MSIQHLFDIFRLIRAFGSVELHVQDSNLVPAMVYSIYSKYDQPGQTTSQVPNSDFLLISGSSYLSHDSVNSPITWIPL